MMDATWVALLLALVALEVYALVNHSPGDTLSGLIWRVLQRVTGGDRRRSLAVAAVIVAVGLWLAWHLALQPGMPH